MAHTGYLIILYIHVLFVRERETIVYAVDNCA